MRTFPLFLNCLSLLHLTPSFANSKFNYMYVHSYTASEQASIKSESITGLTTNFFFFFNIKKIEWIWTLRKISKVHYYESFFKVSYLLAGSDYQNLKVVLCQLCANTSSGRKPLVSGLFSLPLASPLWREGQSETASWSKGRVTEMSLASKQGFRGTSCSHEKVLQNLIVIKTGHMPQYNAVTLHRIQHKKFPLSQDFFPWESTRLDNFQRLDM